MEITPSCARLIQLSTLGLLTPSEKKAEKSDVLAMIRHLGVLQIDTIHVVARSPYLVLWSRLGDYRPVWLEQLLTEGNLFEYWAHAACFIPIEDYPIYRRMMLNNVHGDWRDPSSWLSENAEIANAVLEKIRVEGPLRSTDFESTNKQPGGWWNWKEEKQALEHWLTAGELMVTRRQGFQRVYDLRERVLPDWDDDDALPYEQALRELTLRAVKILGVASQAWTADYFRTPKTKTNACLTKLADEGLLQTTQIEGWPETFYFHPDNQKILAMARLGELKATATTLLSPFDPLVCDRARVRKLFDFEYTIECYLPVAKRSFGYFTMPILSRGALVGRVAAKAHRQTGLFEIRNIALEQNQDQGTGENLVSDIAQAIKACAAWHDTPQIIFSLPSQTNFSILLEAACAKLENTGQV